MIGVAALLEDHSCEQNCRIRPHRVLIVVEIKSSS